MLQFRTEVGQSTKIMLKRAWLSLKKNVGLGSQFSYNSAGFY